MPRKNYKCSTCKVKHSPPTGKRFSRRTAPQPTNGSVTLMSLLDDTSIAHDPEHEIVSERHSGVVSSALGGCMEAASGRSIGARDGYGAGVATSTSEGIDVVLQELRSISARLTHVENSIDQSQSRTSTPQQHPRSTAPYPGYLNTSQSVGASIPSSFSAGRFTMAPPTTTIASTQGLIPSQRAGYVPPPRDPWLSGSRPYGTVSTCSTTDAAGYPRALSSQPGNVFSCTCASQVAGVPSARAGVSAAAGATSAPGNIGEISDCVIPSMTALKASADVQERLNARLQELERAAATSVQGNCQNLSVHDHVCNLKNSCHVNGESCSVKGKTEKKANVVWPQDLAFVGTLRKRPSYEELTMSQWLLGFLRIAEEERDQVKKQNMYAYLTELMQDASDNSWAAAKGAHAVLMYRMQDGVLDWRDLEKIKKIRQTYARSVVQNSGDSNAKRGSGNGVACRNFQSGSCGFPGNHEINGLYVKHVCSHCLSTVGKEFKHPRKDCNKFKLMNSKTIRNSNLSF